MLFFIALQNVLLYLSYEFFKHFWQIISFSSWELAHESNLIKSLNVSENTFEQRNAIFKSTFFVKPQFFLSFVKKS
jgi:hypothetical protein